MLSLYTVIAGTRPEIIKVAPIIRKIQQSKLQLTFVHTGQHYDYALAQQMITDLELPKPNISFRLTKSSPASQIAEIMTKLESSLDIGGDNIVVVQGDTNSVLSASLAAVKVQIPVAHVEAGLRSRDWRMPEEHNRRMVDHISDILFAPTDQSRENLLAENVYGQIFVTGNTVIDAVKEHLPLAEKKSNVAELIKFPEFVLATVHRAENVDNPVILANIVESLIQSELPVVLPLHPRTKERLREFGCLDRIISARNIQILSPQGYLDFLILMKRSRFIVTDSGGIQEEATTPSISKRVLVLRSSTERPEAINLGSARLLSLSHKQTIKELLAEWDREAEIFSHSPYGDGLASEKIINILKTSLPKMKSGKSLLQSL